MGTINPIKNALILWQKITIFANDLNQLDKTS